MQLLSRLTEVELEEVITRGLAGLPLDGRRVLVLVPDRTRTMPLPLFFRLLTRHLLPRVHAVDFLVALGTHLPLSEEAMLAHFGLTPSEKQRDYAAVRLLNHAWSDPGALVTLGVIPAAEIEELSGGRFRREVPVRLNRLVLDYDHLLICGPVYPHEVVGFSGGNKYFFPGIAGPDIIDFTHWLGALLTSYEIIGTKDTAVRRVMDRAAALIPRPRHALCAVVARDGVAGLFFGTPEEAFSAAADLSAQTHIHWLERPYKQVLALVPEMYEDLWTGGKGMYKTEPAVADGGEVIIYAPHITDLSRVHGHHLREIGYHVRDYFAKQWDRFSHYPWGVVAHSTHVRGAGAFEGGIESPRVQVTLATQIPAELCRALNLDYRDPASIDPMEWMAAADDDLLVVPHAGEYLYRVKPS